MKTVRILYYKYCKRYYNHCLQEDHLIYSMHTHETKSFIMCICNLWEWRCSIQNILQIVIVIKKRNICRLGKYWRIFLILTLTQSIWSCSLSTEWANSFVFRRSKLDWCTAKRPNSVVQTGVKSAGWENRTTHL